MDTCCESLASTKLSFILSAIAELLVLHSCEYRVHQHRRKTTDRMRWQLPNVTSFSWKVKTAFYAVKLVTVHDTLVQEQLSSWKCCSCVKPAQNCSSPRALSIGAMHMARNMENKSDRLFLNSI